MASFKPRERSTRGSPCGRCAVPPPSSLHITVPLSAALGHLGRDACSAAHLPEAEWCGCVCRTLRAERPVQLSHPPPLHQHSAPGIGLKDEQYLRCLPLLPHLFLPVGTRFLRPHPEQPALCGLAPPFTPCRPSE